MLYMTRPRISPVSNKPQVEGNTANTVWYRTQEGRYITFRAWDRPECLPPVSYRTWSERPASQEPDRARSAVAIQGPGNR
jgi:hypothetical protein